MGSQPTAEYWSGRAVTVTGGAGFLGGATAALLEQLGASVRAIRSSEHDLRVPDDCNEAVAGADTVFHLAANVGGIGYNREYPAPLARDNMLMNLHVFDACRERGVHKLVAACSVCAYPKKSPIPLREDSIWDGFPEESSAPYGLAKRMLLPLSAAYRHQYGLNSCVPVITNLYGPRDKFDLEHSHVVAAMVRRYVEAVESDEPQVVLWGTGNPTREFLYVDDAARAVLLAGEHYDSSEPFNVGIGEETRIRELAERIAELTGFTGDTVWDTSRPDGQPRRYLDVARARQRLGFEAEMTLEEGLRRTIEWFRDQARHPAADAG